MNNLMYELVCSDIRIAELKLKRIKLCRKQLLNNKPSQLYQKKFKIWQLKLNALKKEENFIIEELNKAYIDLENFFN